MANKTNNYKFPKPEADDFYDISEYNKAMDILDDSLMEMDQKKLEKNGDASEAITEFEQEILRENIESGETLSSTFGKVKKWFAEMKDVAFSGHAKDVTTDAVHRFVSDTEKSNWNGKVEATGGDISETNIDSLESISTEFPVPDQGETTKIFLGKVKKFIQDFNNFKSGIITVGRLVNSGNTTLEGYALDARYGKTLYDLFTKVNSDLSSLTTPIPLTDTASINLDSGLFGENKIYFHTVSSERPKNTKGFPADAYGYGALITGKHNYAWLSFQIYIPHNNATNAGRPIYFRTFADTAANNSPIWRYIEPKMVQTNT